MNEKYYLCWLMNQAQVEAAGPDGYLSLCEKLHQMPFEAINAMDANRGFEGLELREEWEAATDGDIPDTLPKDSCTMLELLVVLARRMNYEMLDSEYEASVRKWFDELLGNLGLDEWRNGAAEADPDGFDVSVKVATDAVIFRKYSWDGQGGLFPLFYPQYDQRKVELLIQMNNYLEENYDII